MCSTWSALPPPLHPNRLPARSEKDIPIDMLELPNKSEKVLQLAWEPRGSRFAVLHGDGARPNGVCGPPAGGGGGGGLRWV